MSHKRKHSLSPSTLPPTPAANAANDDIFRSDPIKDRSSTFTAYYSPTLPPKTLQNLPEIENASHKILAWRKESTQRSLTGSKPQYNAGHDDDGEKYGGKKVQTVLESMNVVGACVVARWYGGVMLGPVRFTHMEECAKQAVGLWQEHVREQGAKKRRVEAEEVERAKLVKSLGERDRSIIVLRALAAGKEREVRDGIVVGVESLTTGVEGNLPSAEATDTSAPTPVAKTESPSTSTKPAVDYTDIPLDRLRALDKARDATLSFLLKRIDKAEADLAALRDAPAEHKPP